METVSAHGVEISYEVHGEDDRGTVLLVCGTGMAAAMWEVIGSVSRLTESGYRVVTFDNRGMTGASCPPPPWTADDMAMDAAAVLEAVGPAHVAGVSLGALITQTLALRHPDLVRTATFIVGGGNFSPTWRLLTKALVELHESGRDVPGSLGDYVQVQSLLTPAQQADEAMVDLALTMADGLGGGYGPGGEHGQLTANLSWSDRDHLGELAGIEPPVLVIAHEHDQVFPPPGQRAVAAALPDGTYVEIPGVSHIAIDPDSLELTTDTILNFLAAHP